MKTVNVHAAKTHFLRLLARVEASEERMVMCRHGQPVADLVPHQRTDRTRPHPALRKITIDYDPVESLSEAEWPKTADDRFSQYGVRTIA